MEERFDGFSAVITDVDGTLYNQNLLKTAMAIKLLMSEPQLIPEIMRFRRNRERGVLVEPTAGVRKWIYDMPLLSIRKYRDTRIIDCLNDYHSKGGVVIAYSDYPAKKKLEKLGLACDFIYDPESVSYASLKPDTTTLKRILSECGLKPTEVIYVGDRIDKDGKCASCCGIEFFHYVAR